MIHSTALVAAGATLGAGVKIGPYAVIEEGVVLDESCEIAAHAVIKRHTRMGARNRIAEHAVIGGDPQDLKFQPGCLSGIEIVPMKDLSFRMAEIAQAHRVSTLGAEAAAAAESLGADICVWEGDDGPGIRTAAGALGCGYRTIRR